MKPKYLALLLTLLMLTACLVAGLSESGQGMDTSPVGQMPGGGAGTPAWNTAASSEGQMQLLAKSGKKKKSTATPAATETPGPDSSADWSPTPVPDGPIIDPQSIADYLFAQGRLPDNFITKREAQELGWDHNYLSDVAPGMSIGGSRFGNYEGQLPEENGRKFYEADCYYTSGPRNAHRIVYSDDGRVWYTGDHYQTFVELFPTGTPGYVSPIR